jgi:N6-L-threonylcarbamoyladenine synthase
MTREGFYNLAIESSCDETSVAILDGGRKVLCNLVSTQIPIHKKFGGVVPEIASRKHLETINRILALAFEEAGIQPQDLSLVSSTRGPGLIGALLVGISAAKSIAYALDIPIVGVNHMHGHISANYLAYPDLEPPFACLVVSGGHTALCLVDAYEDYQVLGRTRDDAAGESLDKAARALGLGYPGGPKIQRLAEAGNAQAFDFPRAMMNRGRDGYDFSFSGLKTAVINTIHQADQRGETLSKADLAASYQEAVVDVLATKSGWLLDACGYKTFCLSGGVAANGPLRARLQAVCQERGVRFCVPPLDLCTDNGAMIGAAGYYQYMTQGPSGLDFAADPDLDL